MLITYFMMINSIKVENMKKKLQIAPKGNLLSRSQSRAKIVMYNISKIWNTK